MATTFLEPGGDATFNVVSTTAGGFWGGIGGAPAIATDFVHGSHIKSIRFRPATGDAGLSPNGILADAGSRFSVYVYLAVLPTGGTSRFLVCETSGSTIVVEVAMTTAGVLQLKQGNSEVQIGSDGSTLSTGKWYRISLAYTITSTTVNR